MLNRFWMAMIAAAFCLTSVVQAQGLAGSQVTGGIYCCQAPTEDYLATNLVTATVGPAVEFPNGVFFPTRGIRPIPVTIDVADSTIDIRYNQADLAAGGAFNGYVLDFAGASDITGVSLDGLSTLTPTSLAWDANSVFISVASQLLPLNSRVLINVVAVPEPAISGMLLGGVVLLGLLGWHRNKLHAEGANKPHVEGGIPFRPERHRHSRSKII